MSVISVPSRKAKFDWPTLALPLLGVTASLVISAALFNFWLDMSPATVWPMVRPFGQVALITNAVGIGLYYLSWFYSRSVRITLFITALLVGALTLINGYFAGQVMFINLDPIVLKDTAIMLIFATVISLAFNLMGHSRMVRNLHRLHQSAVQIGAGNLHVRTEVDGRDEIAQLGSQFNQMAHNLEQAEEERAQLEKMRRDLIAWVSHDLRTPLTSIRAIVEALNDGLVTDEADTKRYYNTILQDITGLNNLINELFEMAQLEAGKTDFPLSPSSISDVIHLSADSLRPVAMQNNITIREEVAADIDPVCANVEKLGRVLNNIISNALKYTPEGGTITVAATRIKQMATISISDTGAGFDPADIPYLFDQFYRGDNARGRTKSGSAGLGLAIARSIVHAHGGTIEASNNVDGGATITFTIPAVC